MVGKRPTRCWQRLVHNRAPAGRVVRCARARGAKETAGVTPDCAGCPSSRIGTRCRSPCTRWPSSSNRGSALARRPRTDRHDGRRHASAVVAVSSGGRCRAAAPRHARSPGSQLVRRGRSVGGSGAASGWPATPRQAIRTADCFPATASLATGPQLPRHPRRHGCHHGCRRDDDRSGRRPGCR